jgi:hypothetical protein
MCESDIVPRGTGFDVSDSPITCAVINDTGFRPTQERPHYFLSFFRDSESNDLKWANLSAILPSSPRGVG